jgi:predicted permease
MVVLGDEGQIPERIPASYVSATTFSVLEVPPLLGRVFNDEDDRRGAPAVVILGEEVWRQRYGSDPSILGRSVTLNGGPVVVIGVMPSRFRFPDIANAWLPLAASPQARDRRRDARTLTVAGRLGDRASIRQAIGELNTVFARLARDYPSTDADLHAVVEPYTHGFSGFDNPWSNSLLAAACLLLIGCGNVASLLLARATGRIRDLAIRIAVGASRWRIVRQLLVESLLLSIVAAILGLGLTLAAVRIWVASLPVSNWPYWFRWDVDARVVAFLAIASAAAAILSGVVPAIQLSRIDAGPMLKRDTRHGSASRITRRWTSAIIAAELALTLVLLAGAGLMIRTTLKLFQIDSVVDSSHVLLANVTLPAARYATADQRSAFVDALVGRLAVAPDVTSASVASAMPFLSAPLRVVSVGGHAEPSEVRGPAVSYVAIGTSYFDALGVRLLVGRTFVPTDGTPGHDSAIVNQRFVEMFLKGGTPLGTTIRVTNPNVTNQNGPWLTIVGISPTIRQHYAQDLDPVVYVPYRQDATGVPLLVVRTNGEPAHAIPIVRQEVNALDKTLVVFNDMPLAQLLSGTGFANEVFLTFFNVFAGFGLLLSAIGLYAATRHMVRERRHEIGVRLALGAEAGQIVWLFTRRISMILAAGAVLGLAGAFACTRLMRGFLVQTDPFDPLTMVTITLLLAAVALIATVIPARSAARLDPLTTLRAE